MTTIAAISDVPTAHDTREPGGNELWTRALRPVLILLVCLIAVLTVTGIILLFRYQPDPSREGPVFSGVAGSQHAAVTHTVRGIAIVRFVHRSASLVLLLLCPLTILLVCLARHSPRARGAWTIAVTTAIASTVGLVTGTFLVWDQLSLWAVTATPVRGFGWLLHGHDVRFVLLGGAETGTDVLLRWLVVHLLIGALLPVALVAFWVRNRRCGSSVPAAQTADPLRSAPESVWLE